MKAKVTLLLLSACFSCGCDEGRDGIFDVEPTMLAPVAMDSAVAFASKTFEKVYVVSFDPGAEGPGVETVLVGRDPYSIHASTAGDRVFVVCHGAAEGEVKKKYAQDETLHVVEAGEGESTAYLLDNPFTGLSESPGGRWLIAYFRSGSEVSGTNPNLMALIDLDEDPSEDNPTIKAIRSLGSIPLSVTFLEDIEIAVPGETGEEVVEKSFALVLSESYVTFFDLLHPERSEISVRLAVPGLGEHVIPTAQDVIVAGDPAGISSRVLLRSDNASDIFSIKFKGVRPSEEGGNDYGVDMNQLSVDVNPNAAPSDMALFEEAGRLLVLVTNRISGSIAVVDPETTMVTPISTDHPVASISIFDDGKSALLYSIGEEMGYFLQFENILEEKEMNLEEYSFGGPLSTFIRVPGKDFAAFTHSGRPGRLFFMDLRDREMHQVYLSSSSSSAQFLMYPDGNHMMINPVGRNEIWFIKDMETYEVEQLILDEKVGSMWLLEEAGKIVLNHQYTEGYLTFIDAENPRRSGAVSIWGFLFEDVLSIDPDDYPLAVQP